MPVVLWNNSPTILIVAAPLRIKQQKKIVSRFGVALNFICISRLVEAEIVILITYIHSLLIELD